MRKKASLFKLIKTLNKSEKRYFKLSIQKNEANSLLLFSILDKQKKYDEKAIRLKLKGTKLLNQLHVAKHYLQKLILRSLKNYHHHDDSYQEILNQIAENDILIKKNLLESALSGIEKTIEKAEKNEHFTLAIEALNQKKKILTNEYGATEMKNEINEIIEKQNVFQNKIFNANKYHYLQANFYDQFKSIGGINPKLYSELNKNPLFLNPDNAETFEAKIIFYNIRFSYCVYKEKNFLSAFEALEQIIRLYERNPVFLRENILPYLSAINNQIELLLHTKSYAEIPSLLKKIRNGKDFFALEKNPYIENQILKSWIFEMELYRDIHDFDKSTKLLPSIRSITKKLNSKQKENFLYRFTFLTAQSLFFSGQKEESKKTIIENINFESITNQTEQISLLFFLLMMIESEQENFGKVKKLAQKCKEIIKNEHRPTIQQKTLLIFFSKINEKAIQKECLNLKKTIEESKNSNENSLFEELKIEYWIEEKIKYLQMPSHSNKIYS